jgi:CBS domain-containing protein
MLKVRDIMLKNVVTAKDTISIEAAVRILHRKHIGSVVITDNEEKCIGIFTERDAIRTIAQKIPLDTPLKKVMTRKVHTIEESASFKEAKMLIVSHGIRHVPVIDRKGKLVGLLAIRGFLDEILGVKNPL